MDLVNYSKVRTITIEETGLLAHSSTELIYFLNVNDIKLVSTFLECVDNNSFKTSTYSDTMLEVRGLADLLKQKYFDLGFNMDIYFDKPIQYIEFTELPTPISLYGVRFDRNHKMNIYSLISRLGFNDKERTMMLDTVSVESIEGQPLIDLLYAAYDEVFRKEQKSYDDQAFCNKLLIILTYYLSKSKKGFDDNEFMKAVYDGMAQINDLLAQKYALEKKIREISRTIPNMGISNSRSGRK